MGRLKYVLPEEMLMEIFYWLPVKSLLLFKSVCKSWLSFISDPEFIKTHSYHQQVIMGGKKASLLMISRSDLNSLPRFNPDPHFDCYLFRPEKRVRVIGLCNGIMLCEVQPVMNYSVKDYHLWNPSTMQSKELPRFPGHEKFDAETFSRHQLAFGYDPKSDDYKVLRIVTEYTPTGDRPVVQVYSSNTDSWKEIHVDDKSPLRGLFYPRETLGPVVKGTMYAGNKRKKPILCFDLQTEACTVVPLPGSMKRYSDVLDFEGSVAAIFGHVDGVSGFSLWTLDTDIHGKASWTKKSDFDKVRHMCCYLGCGLFFGRKDDECESSLYDYRDKDFKYFPLPERDVQEALKYTETLVSVQGFRPNRYQFGHYTSLL